MDLGAATASISRRDDGRWRARYRDEDGKEHARHLRQRQDAQHWIGIAAAAVVTGQNVDPKAGRVTFASFYREWSTRQVWETTTLNAMALSVRTVTFAAVPLNRIQRSHVEQWVKVMAEAGLKPGTIRTRTNNVRAVLRAAVRDRVIALDLSAGVTLPRDWRRVASLRRASPRQVAAIPAAADDRFVPLFTLDALPASHWARRPPSRSGTSTSCTGWAGSPDSCSGPAVAP